MTPDIDFDDFTDITELILEAPVDEMGRDGKLFWQVNLVHNDPDGPCTCHPDTDGTCRSERRRRQRMIGNTHTDFGYTDGLHAWPLGVDTDAPEFEQGWRDAGITHLPELHLPAIPPGGGPPGFSLDSPSLADILNRAASVATMWEFPITGTRFDLSATRDDHRLWMRFVVCSPTNPSEVSANRVADGATVTPII
jgi:hypothetical protein